MIIVLGGEIEETDIEVEPSLKAVRFKKSYKELRLRKIQTFNDPIQIKRFPESFMVFAMRPLADLAVAEPIVEPDNRELCNCLGSGSDRRLSLKRRL